MRRTKAKVARQLAVQVRRRVRAGQPDGCLRAGARSAHDACCGTPALCYLRAPHGLLLATTELLGELRCKPVEPNAALPAAMPAECLSREATADFLQSSWVPAAAACSQQHKAPDCTSRLLSSFTLAGSRHQAGTAGERPSETRAPCGARTCGRGAGRAATEPAARRAAAMM